MAVSGAWIFATFAAALVVSSLAAEEPAGKVLALDAVNFNETVANHSFIVVQFYAPWCGHCKNLAPKYEKAASILSSHDPPIILAKVDADAKVNEELASAYNIQSYPTIKILRDGGKRIQEYHGPRDADGIVKYLKKQIGSASIEIKSAEDADRLIKENKIFIVGAFPEFSGVEYENFVQVAEKLRSHYDFGHTSDAKLLPRGDSAIDKPLIRLFKPYDELFVDFQDFNVEAIQTFIEHASVPLVITFDEDPVNHPFLEQFFNTNITKVMLYLDFQRDDIDVFKTKYHEAAGQFKGENLSFLIGDLDASQGALQFYGLREDRTPLIIIQDSDGEKYLKMHVQANEILGWLKEYTDDHLKPYRKSQHIPKVNNDAVKIVVADTLDDMFFNSDKNVLLEFYAPWCGHCKKLEPILDEVAVSFENDPDVVIAKIDATANDIPKYLNVQGFPTLYFYSAAGALINYNGNRTAEEIIKFVQESKGVQPVAIPPDSAIPPNSAIPPDSVKDEL